VVYSRAQLFNFDIFFLLQKWEVQNVLCGWFKLFF
jgi:hypothetical protein